MPTYDFEDNLIPSVFKNADNNPWVTTSASANAGTYAMKSSAGLTHEQRSDIYIIGDFAAGNFDCSYKISSESNGDVGYIIVDGVEIIQVDGNGAWQAMAQQSLSAGVHCIQFVYIRDASGMQNDDCFYIDDITLPTFTDLKGDVEYFASGVPAGWTNDPTAADEWTASTGLEVPFVGLKSASGTNKTSTLEYTSDAGAPAGEIFFLGHASSEKNYDYLKFYIDGVEKYSDSGKLYTYSDHRAPLGYHQTVTSGSHTYKWEYTTDSGVSNEYDAGLLHAFYEPSYTSGGGLIGTYTSSSTSSSSFIGLLNLSGSYDSDSTSLSSYIGALSLSSSYDSTANSTSAYTGSLGSGGSYSSSATSSSIYNGVISLGGAYNSNSVTTSSYNGQLQYFSQYSSSSIATSVYSGALSNGTDLFGSYASSALSSSSYTGVQSFTGSYNSVAISTSVYFNIGDSEGGGKSKKKSARVLKKERQKAYDQAYKLAKKKREAFEQEIQEQKEESLKVERTEEIGQSMMDSFEQSFIDDTLNETDINVELAQLFEAQKLNFQQKERDALAVLLLIS